MSKEYSDTQSFLDIASEPETAYGASATHYHNDVFLSSFVVDNVIDQQWSELQKKLSTPVVPMNVSFNWIRDLEDTLAVYSKLANHADFNKLISVPDIHFDFPATSFSVQIGKSKNSSTKRPSEQTNREAMQQSSYSSDTSIGQEFSVPASVVATDSSDINRINREFLIVLEGLTPRFLTELRCEVFEDGMDNDSIAIVREFMTLNEMATYNWLYRIFSRYENDRKIVTGILRIISMTVKREDYDSLLPIVTAALRSHNADEQEAAVMVIEEWRSDNCMSHLSEALDHGYFESPMLKSYAAEVYAELQQEKELV